MGATRVSEGLALTRTNVCAIISISLEQPGLSGRVGDATEACWQSWEGLEFEVVLGLCRAVVRAGACGSCEARKPCLSSCVLFLLLARRRVNGGMK